MSSPTRTTKKHCVSSWPRPVFLKKKWVTPSPGWTGWPSSAPTLSGRTDALRIYAPQEQERLSAECRGFLLYLEQLGILNSESRELVIERLLALEEEVDLERVKWVCLLVLINQPGEEEAAVHLEDMVYYQGEFLH